MTNATTVSSIAVPSLQTAYLTAGISALEQMLVEEAEDLAGPRESRG
jgi:hypothetical protein